MFCKVLCHYYNIVRKLTTTYQYCSIPDQKKIVLFFVLQNTRPILLCSTKNPNEYQTTTPDYCALKSITPVLLCTTLKVLLWCYSDLQRIISVVLCPTTILQCYKVHQQILRVQQVKSPTNLIKYYISHKIFRRRFQVKVCEIFPPIKNNSKISKNAETFPVRSLNKFCTIKYNIVRNFVPTTNLISDLQYILYFTELLFD